VYDIDNEHDHFENVFSMRPAAAAAVLYIDSLRISTFLERANPRQLKKDVTEKSEREK